MSLLFHLFGHSFGRGQDHDQTNDQSWRLTEEQSRCLRVSRVRASVAGLVTGLAQAAWDNAHLKLVGYDRRAMMRLRAQLAALAALGAVLLGPAAGSVSDAIGRRPVLLANAIGRMLWRFELMRVGGNGGPVRIQRFSVLILKITSHE